MTKILITLMTLTFLFACTPKGTKPETAADSENDAAGKNTNNSGTGGVQVGAVNQGGIGGMESLAGKDFSVSYEKGAVNDPKNILSNHTIYFDYDSSDIKAEYEELVKHHGKYLALHSGVKIRLEGHTDERGSREYNIALADRRAQAVKRLLTFQGASSNQVTIISYGEEKPAVFGQDEESWSLNRRAELEYLE